MPTSPRTQTLLSWLPATILLLIIGGVIFGTIAVQNSWWAEEAPVASSDQKATDGSSKLSDAGLDYVNVEGVLRVRVGEGALPVTEVGLSADEEKKAEFRRPVRTIVAAGDEVYVVEDVETMTAIAKDGELASVSLGVGQVLPWANAVGTVQGLASEFGWSQDDIAAWDQQISDFTRENTEGSFTAEVKATDAATVTGTVVFDRASGNTTLTITFEPAR